MGTEQENRIWFCQDFQGTMRFFWVGDALGNTVLGSFQNWPSTFLTDVLWVGFLYMKKSLIPSIWPSFLHHREDAKGNILKGVIDNISGIFYWKVFNVVFGWAMKQCINERITPFDNT